LVESFANRRRGLVVRSPCVGLCHLADPLLHTLGRAQESRRSLDLSVRDRDAAESAQAVGDVERPPGPARAFEAFDEEGNRFAVTMLVEREDAEIGRRVSRLLIRAELA
jgi:hypothetical protein